MPRKCVETNCGNEGKYKVTSLDNLTLFVCGQHLNSWVNDGCSVVEKTSKRIREVLVRYVIYSAFFFSGFSLILYEIGTWVGQFGISLYSLELWLGSVFIIVSWIMSFIGLRRASRKK
jgi:hypothetical protein